MPFFPQHALFPEAQLYQFLASLDDSQPKQACQARRRPQPTFNPKFDIAEVDAAYELYGELPGIEQKDIEIEFTDAQTIVIKGKTERSQPQVAQTQPEQVKEKEIDTSSEKSHAATVEDEYDEADTPLDTPASTTSSTTATHEQAPVAEAQQAPKPKFWVTERKVGEFARSFSFAQRIEHDGVQASLKNGILKVVVPKSQKSGKVVVNVF